MEMGASFVIGLIIGMAIIKAIEKEKINRELEQCAEPPRIRLIPMDTNKDKIKIMKFNVYMKLAEAQAGRREREETLKKAAKIANEIGDGTGLI